MSFAHQQTTNTGRILTQTWFKQQLFGPKSVELLHCWRSHASREMPLLIYSKRHSKDVFMPWKYNAPIFEEHRFSQLATRIRKNICDCIFLCITLWSLPSESSFMNGSKRNDTMGSCLYNADWEDEFREEVNRWKNLHQDVLTQIRIGATFSGSFLQEPQAVWLHPVCLHEQLWVCAMNF